MLWIAFALLYGLARAIAIDARRQHKAPLSAIAGQMAAAIVLVLPFGPFMDWGQPALFYVAAILTGAAAGLALLIHDTLHRAKRGRIFNIHMPLEALLAFLIWFTVVPGFRASFASDMLQTASVGLSFALAVIALSLMRRSDVSLEQFLLAAAVGMTAAVAAVVTKFVLPDGRFGAAAMAFVLVQSLSAFAIIGSAGLRGAGRFSQLKAGSAFYTVVGGLGQLGSQIAFTASLVYAPNPGYAMFTAMLLPVWLLSINKLRRAEENASPAAALLLVISTMTLLMGAVLSAPP